MSLPRSSYAAYSAAIALLLFAGWASAAGQEKDYEDFGAAKFDHSTAITNEWCPLQPGTRFTWDGSAIDEEGDTERHSSTFTVTDLTKVIAGVRTVVCWDRGIVDGELEESELIFFAQDNNGNVWQLGEYPEEYDDGKFDKAPCWMQGVGDGRAGIMMPAKPKPGAASYSEGWSPSIKFTDRAVVDQMGQTTKVPSGSYDNVLVIDEWDQEEPNAHQLKYYARGVGNVRVGWRGEGNKDHEELELIKIEQLSADDLAKAREDALQLERSAYEHSKDVFANTKPSEHATASAGAR
jgi:hypothetical protein